MESAHKGELMKHRCNCPCISCVASRNMQTLRHERSRARKLLAERGELMDPTISGQHAVMINYDAITKEVNKHKKA